MKKETPKVQVVKSEKINISIWFVPIIALLISLWLAYQYFSKLGPEITIEFESSSGLKAKQSQIRFRDVPVGMVQKISLKTGGKGVIITAQINKDAREFLNRNAKFWIVKPKIDKTGITGLETLVSGSYIQLDSALGGAFRDKFLGLKEPYLDEKNIKGKYFKLSAPDSYNLQSGSMIYYKNINVGEVRQVKLSTNGDLVKFNIFVKEPYHKFINTQTQFWNMSSFKLDMSKARLDISLASTSQIILGAISFSTPQKRLNKYPIKDKHIFALFSSKTDAKQKCIGYNFSNMQTFKMQFDDSVAKLEIDAPIKFNGFDIGHVVNVESSYNPEKGMINSLVLADIDMSTFQSTHIKSFVNLENALKNGLVAKLAQTNPLVDNLYIELVYDKNKTPYKIISADPYDIFPTKNTAFDNIGKKITTVLNSITKLVDTNKQPLHDILKNLNSAIKNIEVITATSELSNLPKQINSSLLQLESTLKSTQKLVSSESKMSNDITETMQEVSKASKALERVLRKIDQKPNSLIFGE